ncbi:acyltransferase [Sinorhizobium sp. BG8]|uniref:acyltransferase family protein n=1 Tax=Sinorhizobium sp. BG8 TaxID=2613773 RepID=UPI00193D542C|nr:acyltransferase [Sinorhizobium sp. BG8]QRM55218.1 acyltransferase [Sinorhizobium sp. BG8]
MSQASTSAFGSDAVFGAGVATRERLAYLHYFRGLTMLQIMIMHAGRGFMLRGYDEPVAASNPVFIANDILFHNTTLYFTLISGIFYSRSLSKQPVTDFYKGRLRNIAAPYVVMTVLFTTLVFFLSANGAPDGISIGSFARTLGYNLLWGEAQVVYWYIPVVLLLYALSPVLHALLASRFRNLLLASAIILPMLFSRTGTEVTLSTILYFTGAYIIGLYLGRDIEGRLTDVSRYAWLLGLLAVAATATLVVLNARDIDYWGPTSLRESVYYVQKLSLGLLLMLWVWRFSGGLPPGPARLLSLFGSYAFGLYFLHGFVFRRFIGFSADIASSPDSNWDLVLGGAITFLLGTATCFAVIFVLRWVLGRYSRLVVGA